MSPSQFNTGDGLVPVEFPTGVWVAYYTDRSGAYVFGDEVSALRAAVDKCAKVKFVPFGEDVWGRENDERTRPGGRRHRSQERRGADPPDAAIQRRAVSRDG